MSRENVEIVRRVAVAFRDGDWAAAAAPLHPDMEMDTTRAPVSGLAGVYKGLEAVASHWAEWLEAWGAQDYDDPEFIDAGDQVVAWFTGHRLRGRGSSVEVGMPPYAWVAKVREGRIVQSTMYMDEAEALEAVGLRE